MKNEKTIIKKTASFILALNLVLASCSLNEGAVTEEDTRYIPPIVVDVLSALDDTQSPTEDSAPVTDSCDNAEVFKFATDPIKLEISAEFGAVLDVESGEVLYAKGWGEKIYPASTTKLLTALFALSVCEPSVVFTPGDELELVASDSSIAYIKSNHALTLEMLIEGMLLPSGNDAAYVVAAGVGKRLAGEEGVSAREAVTKFMVELNKYAKSIGLTGTQFTCPDGYHNDDHYTTLADMLMIGKLASENEIIHKYANTVTDDVTYASGHKMTWSNTNSLIDPSSPSYYRYADGLKTGTTEEAGYCLVASADKDGHRLIACIFNSKSNTRRFSDAKELFEEAYDSLS